MFTWIYMDKLTASSWMIHKNCWLLNQVGHHKHLLSNLAKHSKQCHLKVITGNHLCFHGANMKKLF